MMSRNPPQWKFRNPWDKRQPSGAGEFDFEPDTIQIRRMLMAVIANHAAKYSGHLWAL